MARPSSVQNRPPASHKATLPESWRKRTFDVRFRRPGLWVIRAPGVVTGQPRLLLLGDRAAVRRETRPRLSWERTLPGSPLCLRAPRVIPLPTAVERLSHEIYQRVTSFVPQSCLPPLSCAAHAYAPLIGTDGADGTASPPGSPASSRSALSTVFP
ncbi:hypothetical protein SKAU_G00073400 [Synaphobranchus kaupii]|uniref:Uncharacterized protein n=1 Tax=Synaphobranchus kaupii TaxID=118154 RepID=A0A9Q1G8T5_SYNKA|nr:hypothetical protein SKAU_G00073400 [Synaphobranchus kaupii]